MTLEELMHIAEFWYWQGVEGCESPPSFKDRWDWHKEQYALMLERKANK